MLNDIAWLSKALEESRGTFNKELTKEFIGRTLEYAKGRFDQRELDLAEIIRLKNSCNIKFMELKRQIDALMREVKLVPDA